MSGSVKFTENIHEQPTNSIQHDSGKKRAIIMLLFKHYDSASLSFSPLLPQQPAPNRPRGHGHEASAEAQGRVLGVARNQTSHTGHEQNASHEGKKMVGFKLLGRRCGRRRRPLARLGPAAMDAGRRLVRHLFSTIRAFDESHGRGRGGLLELEFQLCGPGLGQIGPALFGLAQTQ